MQAQGGYVFWWWQYLWLSFVTMVPYVLELWLQIFPVGFSTASVFSPRSTVFTRNDPSTVEPRVEGAAAGRPQSTLPTADARVLTLHRGWWSARDLFRATNQLFTSRRVAVSRGVLVPDSDRLGMPASCAANP